MLIRALIEKGVLPEGKRVHLATADIVMLQQLEESVLPVQQLGGALS